jgi:hypothetical protein
MAARRRSKHRLGVTRCENTFWDGVVTAVVAVEPASAHSTLLRKAAALGQDGHACMASAETSRNSFSVAPLAD